ncbi:Uncharacterised protein [Klebsiella oxytoca]|nr:Uncharacterised protein [Klebsiella oxytoca]SAP52858.1 Uncharacterised protein [Klebsiella oxytoca]SAQ21069.1 Uncharacterised protein [Klebsiella oxytoca]
MVFTTNNVGDFHIPVVNHDAEVIGWRTIGTANNQIVQLMVAEFDRTADLVVKNNGPLFRVGKTNNARFIISMMFVTMAAATVITRLFAFCHLFFTQRFQTLFRAIAFIGRARLQHFINDGVIAIKTLGLEVRALIPFQAQPVHTIHDGFNGLRRGALKIGIFNTQHKLTAVVTCKKPGIESSTRAANVQIACRAGREASFDFHEVALRLIKVPTRGSVRWILWRNILTPWADSSMLLPFQRHALPFLFINHAS